MDKKASRKKLVLCQVGVLPYRLRKDDGLEILLVSTKDYRKFTIPKGWLKKSWGKRKSARREAEQEAGLIGKLSRKVYGSYSFHKRLNGEYVSIYVDVYLMMVEDQLEDWLEKNIRSFQWLSADEAVETVDQPQLASLISSLSLDPRLNGKHI